MNPSTNSRSARYCSISSMENERTRARLDSSITTRFSRSSISRAFFTVLRLTPKSAASVISVRLSEGWYTPSMMRFLISSYTWFVWFRIFSSCTVFFNLPGMLLRAWP